jgi:hypothetical protein
MTSATTTIVLAPPRRHLQLCAYFTTQLWSEPSSCDGPGGSGDGEADRPAFANAEEELPIFATAQPSQPASVPARDHISVGSSVQRQLVACEPR